MMQIDAQQKEVRELFSGNSKYQVPMYQRNYAWQNPQVDSFLDDLKYTVDHDDDHFFGSIVLLEGRGQTPDSLIDGQQRMTTFVLTICAIRDVIHEALSDDVVMVGDHPKSLKEMTSALLRTENDFSLRFIANHRIQQIFDQYVQFDPSSPMRKNFTIGGAGLSPVEKKHTTDLRRAFLRIKTWLNTELDEIAGDEGKIKSRLYAMLIAIRNRATILRIGVQDEDDAFVLFETLNDRGLRLTPSDLLKSFTLREIGNDNQVLLLEDALDKWDSAVDQLGDYPFTKFLRHYLLSMQKDKVQVSKIFALFKKIISNYGDGGAVRNLHELAEAAKIYAQLLEDGNTGDPVLDRIIGRLNYISETHRILLMKAFHVRFGKSDLKKLAAAVEVLAFRWVLTGGNAQDIESFYQRMAMKLKSDDSAVLTEIIDDVLSMVPSDELVRSTLTQNTASKNANFQFYVLQKLSYGITKTELNWSRQQLHIEHLAPQKPFNDSGWFESVAPKSPSDPNEKSYDDFAYQWGNLTLLEFEINTQIGNASWAVKLNGQGGEKGIKDSQVSMTKNLARSMEWNRETIVARTLWLAEAIVSTTSVGAYLNPSTVSQFK